MEKSEIFSKILEERVYQEKWGAKFDSKNTPNDWVSYITQYTGKSVTMPFDEEQFRLCLIKVAALCMAALEQEKYAPRHYDQ